MTRRGVILKKSLREFVLLPPRLVLSTCLPRWLTGRLGPVPVVKLLTGVLFFFFLEVFSVFSLPVSLMDLN